MAGDGECARDRDPSQETPPIDQVAGLRFTVVREFLRHGNLHERSASARCSRTLSEHIVRTVKRSSRVIRVVFCRSRDQASPAEVDKAFPHKIVWRIGKPEHLLDHLCYVR